MPREVDSGGIRLARAREREYTGLGQVLGHQHGVPGDQIDVAGYHTVAMRLDDETGRLSRNLVSRRYGIVAEMEGAIELLSRNRRGRRGSRGDGVVVSARARAHDVNARHTQGFRERHDPIREASGESRPALASPTAKEDFLPISQVDQRGHRERACGQQQLYRVVERLQRRKGEAIADAGTTGDGTDDAAFRDEFGRSRDHMSAPDTRDPSDKTGDGRPQACQPLRVTDVIQRLTIPGQSEPVGVGELMQHGEIGGAKRPSCFYEVPEFTVGGAMGSVKEREVLFVASLRRPRLAVTARRLSAGLVAALGESPDPSRYSRWIAEVFAEAPPRDDPSALRRLLAEDLVMILPRLGATRGILAEWDTPEERLHRRFEELYAALTSLGIAFERPSLRLVHELPAAYAAPTLDAVSIDAADALAYGIAPGIYCRLDRARPFATESTLGHVLVHAALGQRSPRLMGRGLEEGLCELLGGLWAAGQVDDRDLVDLAWLDRNLGMGASRARLALIAHTRAAAWLLRQRGLTGLVALVNGGREAIQAVEDDLSEGRYDEGVATATDAMTSRLDRLLQLSLTPLVVRPLVFHIARALREGTSFAAAATTLGIPEALVRQEAHELAESTYLLVTDAHGNVLASEVPRMIRTSHLRYDPLEVER